MFLLREAGERPASTNYIRKRGRLKGLKKIRLGTCYSKTSNAYLLPLLRSSFCWLRIAGWLGSTTAVCELADEICFRQNNSVLQTLFVQNIREKLTADASAIFLFHRMLTGNTSIP